MKNKGITLLALIVTVILMMILAGVSINLITNGGIIDKTKESAKAYQYAADKEQFELAKIGATDYLTDEVDEEKMEIALEDWEKEGEIWTSPNGNKFTLNGEVPEKKEDEEVEDALLKYILGEDLKGRPLWNDEEGMEGLGILECNDEEETYFCVDSTGMLDKGLKEIPEYITEDWSQYQEEVFESIFYIKYDGSYYKFGTIYEIPEEEKGKSSPNGISLTTPDYGVKKIEDIEIATSKEKPGIGSKIYYDNQKWTVLYSETNEIQMVSDIVKYYDETKVNDWEKELNLGYNDSYLSKHGELEGTTDIEKSIYSYNNAIETLNKACEEIVDTTPSYIKDVRCIGSNPKDKNSENTELYESTFLANYPSGNAIYNGVGKSSDENYISDYDRMVQLGINKASYTGELDDGDSYWLASRFVGVYSDEVYFRVRYVSGDGSCGNDCLWYVYESDAYGNYGDNGLRPVVSLKSDICNFTWDEGNGYFTISSK